jgi:hypothetical protein
MHRIMNRTTRRENDIFDSEFVHDFVETHAPTDVVLVVFEGVFATFANGFKGSEMDDSVNFVFLEDFPHFLSVFEVDLVKFRLPATSGEFADESREMVKHRKIGVAEVIDNYDIVSFLSKDYGCM